MALDKRYVLLLVVVLLLTGCTAKPSENLSLASVSDVSAGIEHTLFLTDDGTVWGVGANTYMQLGTDRISGRVLIPTPLTYNST